MAEITGINGTSNIAQQNIKKEVAEKKKEEFNSAFTENKKTKIGITSRGAGEPAGLSYDFYYGNENTTGLKEYFESGIFEDTTKDKAGNDKFTNQDKRNLVSKFQEIHSQKGLKTNFSKMQIGETFEYSKEEYLALAEAAGYKLKEKPVEPQLPPIEETSGSENIKAATQTPSKEELAMIETNHEHKAKEAISQPSVMPKSLTPETPAKIADVKEFVTIPEDYSTSSEKQIVEYLKTTADLKDKNPQEIADKLINDISTLAKLKESLSATHKTIKGKKFLLWRSKDKQVNWTPEEKAYNQEIIKELNARIDKAQFYKAYVDKVEKATEWNGQNGIKISYNEDGSVNTVHPEFTKVTIIDANGNEQKVARLDVYDWGAKTERSIYHPITIRKVVDESSNSAKPYYEVVADIATELKNVTEKN